MKTDQLRELLAIGYNGQVPFAEFVRMVDKAIAQDERESARIADDRARYHAELGNAAVSNECRYIAARIRGNDDE